MTAAIAYDLPVKNLIDALSRTGHVSHRSYRKTSVTFHHNAGRLSHEGVLNVWKTRPASAHFDVDGKGAVAQYVKVNEYAWATASTAGNQSSISIELANSSTGGQWPVAEVTWKSGARLAGWLFAKVIGVRPSRDNVKYHHHWFNGTSCAGPYMDAHYSQLIAECQKWYDHYTGAKSVHTAAPAQPASRTSGNTPRKSVTAVVAEVWAGKWGTGADRVARLRRAGYDPKQVQDLVNRGIGKHRASEDPNRKSVGVVAREVIAGKWGNGADRVRRLQRAGYDANAVQREVNRLV